MDLPICRLRKRGLLVALILALGVSGGCKQGPWTLWGSYSSRFIDGQGRVIDPQGGARTTSEGQAYAMFFALVANDRPCFDRVLTWTRNNLASGDLETHLPAWLWGKNQAGEWKTLDPNPASDADVWIAYSLLEAGRFWKNPAYTNQGRRMMAQIAAREVADLPGFGLMLMPAPTGFQHGKVWTLNPSYLPLFLFQRLAVVDPAGPWRQIARGIPKLLQQSSRHGFAMDWVDYIPGDGFSPSTAQSGRTRDGMGGSYDAIRVYLWAGMIDPSGKTRGEVLNAVAGMSGYLAHHGAPPEKVSDEGIPQAQDGPVGFSAAVLPYLRGFPQLEKANSVQTLRMSGERDPGSGLYGKNVAYYDQNLALFATGFLEGRFRFGPGGELKLDWMPS